MKKVLALLAVVVTVGLSSMALDAEAKRLGGGKSSGMQRQQTTSTPAAPAGNQAGTPAQAAPAAGTAAAAAAPAAAAAATKRSWMGPIAGLAAGLGLAALASHLGFGEAFANMLMIGLLVMAVIAVIGFVMRKRMAAQNPAMAGAGAPNSMLRTGPQDQGSAGGQGGSLIGSRLGGGVANAAQAGTFPAGFDAPAFERNAKTQFMAVQAANDAADLERLRDYLSPEMLELAREEIAERAGAVQKTEVFGLEARVLAVAEEADGYVASVHFTGSTRGQHGAAIEDLDEIWHLTKPRTGFGGWVIAGIQQRGA